MKFRLERSEDYDANQTLLPETIEEDGKEYFIINTIDDLKRFLRPDFGIELWNIGYDEPTIKIHRDYYE